MKAAAAAAAAAAASRPEPKELMLLLFLQQNAILDLDPFTRDSTQGALVATESRTVESTAQRTKAAVANSLP